MVLKQLFLAIAVLLQVSLYAQSITCGIPLVDNYSRENYAANNDNWAIEQDDRGVMFFGNSAGILEFDGNHWKNIAPGTFVYDMNKAKNGVIYVAMDNDFGYIGYNEIGESKYYSLLEHYRPTNDYVGTFYTNIEVGDSIYFLSNRGYLYKLNNNQLSHIRLPERKVGRYKTLRFVNDQFMLQTPDGLAVIERDSFKLIERGEYFKDKSIEEIFQNGKDTAMLVTRLNGLFELTGDGYRSIFSKGSDFIKKNQVYVATKVDSNRFGFGSIQSGVLLTDKRGKPIYNINRKGGLQSNDHCEIFTDNNKNIWSGLENGISSIYISSPFTQMNEHYNLPLAKIYSMLIHGNHFYVGTAQGAYYAELDPDNKAELNFEFVEKPGVRKVMDMVEFDGQYIISTSGTGTYIVDGLNSTQITSFTFKHLIPYDENHLVGPLFYGGLGVLERKGKSWEMHATFQNIPSINYFTLDDNLEIWVVEDEKRLKKFQLSEGLDSLLDIQYFDSLGCVQSCDSISIFKLGDEVLFGTTKGTFQYKKGTFQAYDAFNQAVGSNVFVETVHADRNGNNWFMGNASDNVVIGKILTNPAGNVFNIENYIAPLQRLSDYLIGMFYPYDEENVFIGTSERIIHFDPTKSEQTQKPYSLAIRSVEITKPVDSLLFGGTFVLDKQIYTNQPDQLAPTIRFKHNAIRISYSALFYESPADVQYQYKLIGYDKQWSEWTGQAFKEYNYLPEGKYKFLVRATNVYGIQSSTASYRFEIKAPWYRTALAYLAYMALFILLVYSLMKQSQRRLVKKNEKLEKTIAKRTAEVVEQKQEIENKNKTLVAQNVEIMHQAEQLNDLNKLKDRLFSIISHDLRSPLLSLFTLLSMAKDNIVSEARFRQEIDKLSRQVGHTRDLTDNLLNWAYSQMEGFSAKPKSFNLFNLVKEKILLQNEIADSKGVKIINVIEPNTMVLADENMIELVLRNLLTNGIKFCKSGDTIVVSSSRESEFVVVRITDTGIGISAEDKEKLFGKETYSTPGTNREKGSGLGLMLCKDFVELNGGSIWVKSTEGEGSTFFFTVPVS